MLKHPSFVETLVCGSMFNRFKEVVTHMRDSQSETSGRFPGMHITVGHYPTLKGIAGALDIGGLDGIPPWDGTVYCDVYLIH